MSVDTNHAGSGVSAARSRCAVSYRRLQRGRRLIAALLWWASLLGSGKALTAPAAIHPNCVGKRIVPRETSDSARIPDGTCTGYYWLAR